MHCVSPKKGLDSKGRLKPGHKYLPGGKPCIVPAGRAASSGAKCKFGRVKRGKRKGKCRTAPLPDFNQFGRGRKVPASVREAMRASMQRGWYPISQDRMRSDIAAGRSYQAGAAAFAARRGGRRPRNARGQFI